MTQHRFSAFIAKASEHHISTIIAAFASLVVMSIFTWTLFSQTTEERTPQFTDTIAVSTVEKPALAKKLTQPAPTKTVHSSKQAPLNPKLQKRIVKTIPTKLPASTTKQAKVTIGKGKLFVQVGAFNEVAHARISYEKMRKKYKRARIVPKDGHYAIWVGPVSTRAEAETLKKHILLKDKIEGFITFEK